MAALICSRKEADDFDACTAFGEGLTSSTTGIGFLATLLGAGLGTAGAGGAKRLDIAGRACCILPETVFVPRRGPLVVTLGVTGVGSFSAAFNVLDFVGERALVEVLTLRLLGVAVVNLPPSVVVSAFDGAVFGVNKGTGGIPPSCEVGREL